MQPMVICDTNIISKYIVYDSEVQRKIHFIGLKNVIITPIVYIELMRWLSVYKGIPSTERVEIKRFIKGLKIYHLNKGISELSIEISQKDNSLEPSDILIGATGVYYNLPVYTHNLKHFKLIKGITLYEKK